MEIIISKESKFYIVAHANFATGGLEALHQLGRNIINELGVQAFMYYLPLNHPDPVHKEYKNYNVPIAYEIEDSEKNILIVPEVTFGINSLKNYKNIKKAVWWLSVDNFYGSIYSLQKEFLLLSDRIIKNQSVLLNDLFEVSMNQYNNTANLFQLFTEGANLLLNKALNSADFNLCQSHYSLRHLESKGFNNLEYFTDYITEDFLKIRISEDDLAKKENIAVYNPKGSDFSEKIKKYARDITFVPIANMNKTDVIEMFLKAKVHINFGSHPGKDRITREAAHLGCCVITGRKGGAAYYEDVPIPDGYKFEDIEENIPHIINKIKKCFDNYNEEYKNFEFYRNIIKNEKIKSFNSLKRIFLIKENNIKQ